MSLNDTYTSTGSKFFCHQEAMTKLRNGQGQPVVTHVMLTDVCNHKCAFCSVQARVGDSLAFDDVMTYLDTLIRYGLKAVILSGGGNPILYKNGGKDFNDVVKAIHDRGLEIGLITNGMPLQRFPSVGWEERRTWKTVRPEILDKLTWIRISMSGLDHAEREVYVPDIDPTKTTLGFSYVAHDIYDCPEDPHHGKVSTKRDVFIANPQAQPLESSSRKVWTFESRIAELTNQLIRYGQVSNPRYIRLLPNCLEPSLIPQRCRQLENMSEFINAAVGRKVAFVQNKPPKAPHACYLGYIHPVLNCDGFVYPCDSCVLNETAGHSFANPWRVCHMGEIENLYTQPVRSLIADPGKTCLGCVFPQSNLLLKGVVDGGVIPPAPENMEHPNFV